MNLIDFINHYPNEESCKAKFKQYRDQVGGCCAKCGRSSHYWKKDKEQYECKDCDTFTDKERYLMHNKSKLPYLYWFITMHLLISTKESFSAKKIQRQLGHKRYAPIWHMVHKLRLAMGKRGDHYILAGAIELDDGFFTTEVPQQQKEEPLKRGRGSQKKSKVLVMAECEMVVSPKKGQKPRRVGYLKMKVIDDLKKETIDAVVQNTISSKSSLHTDDSTSYVNLHQFVESHPKEVIPKEVIPKAKIGEKLPWVHIAISNAKRQLLNSHHNIKPEFLQAYLDEFCYKFNRKYFGEGMFGRLLVAAVSNKNEFRYKSG